MLRDRKSQKAAYVVALQRGIRELLRHQNQEWEREEPQGNNVLKSNLPLTQPLTHTWNYIAESLWEKEESKSQEKSDNLCEMHLKIIINCDPWSLKQMALGTEVDAVP